EVDRARRDPRRGFGGELGRGGHGGDDVVPGALQECDQSVTQQCCVLGEQDPHDAPPSGGVGTRSSRVVGPPSGLSSSSVPPRRRARACTLTNPVPVGSAPPLPSSMISRISVPPEMTQRIRTCWAPECRTTFVSASRAT